jgi:ankyrin repeat protein
MSHQYKRVMGILASGTPDQWSQLAFEIPSFPQGSDDFVNRRWIINAVGSGCSEAVKWMLGEHLDLNFRDDEGYTTLHVALERDPPERYEMLEILLNAGASVNLKGINDWTPAHMAAARDDVKALRILIRFGADLSIRTNIDEHATPLEEARNLGKRNAAKFLEDYSNGSND